MRLNEHENTKRDYTRARRLRNEATGVERKFWRMLSVQAAARGIKFRRQQSLHPYIADFACMEARVVVELDGESHDERQKYDEARDIKMKRDGFEVLRFSNQEVRENGLGIVETILDLVEKRIRENVGRLVLTSKVSA